MKYPSICHVNQSRRDACAPGVNPKEIAISLLCVMILYQNAALAADPQPGESSITKTTAPSQNAQSTPAEAEKPSPAPKSDDETPNKSATSNKSDSLLTPADEKEIEDVEGKQNHVEEKQVRHMPFFKRLLHKVSFFKLNYYFVAQNPSNCDLFYGLVVDNPLIGRASLNFAFPSGCNCHGIAQVTHNPPFGGGAGQRGYIKAKCSDGRTMKGKFTTASVTTGNGTVSDSLGNEYQFTFGHTADQAVQQVNLLRKKLGCEEVTGKEIELKVHAEILKKD